MKADMSISGKRGLDREAGQVSTKRLKPTRSLGISSISDVISMHSSNESSNDHVPIIDLTEDEPMLDAVENLSLGTPVKVNDVEGSSTDSATLLMAVNTQQTCTSRATTPDPVYDVCFGSLFMEAACFDKANVPTSCTPVRLEFDGTLIRIYLENSNNRIGGLHSPALWRLVNDFPVTLTATLCGKKLKTVGIRETGNGSTTGPSLCSLRVVVYGFRRQGDTIGDFLAQKRQYLQHPCETEIDREVEYMNPQYLLPPGEKMPPLEKLSILTCCAGRGSGSGSTRDLLREKEKNEILKIFDTAYESVKEIANIQPSARLITSLKRHQIVALAMMVEKEAGIYDSAHFPTIWIPILGPNGRIRYQNIVTEKFTLSRPPSMGGGILADEMGLGKTLSSLSLICHSMDVMEGNPELAKEFPKGTLIVVPKSTIYGWESQIQTHIRPNKVRLLTYHGPKRQEAQEDMDSCDIVLATYDTLRSDRRQNGLLFKKGWGRVILDEAHKIRNRSSKIFGHVCALRARNRWCLTGTPIQNSLDDFGALLAFVGVHPFESKDNFEEYVSRPIKERKCNSLATLRKVVAATCLRRTKAEHGLTLNLPRKTEITELIQMSRHDRQLYSFFKRFSYLTAGLDRSSKRKPATNIVVLISMLRLICDHGEAILPASALKAWRDRDETALDWAMLEGNIKCCVVCDAETEDLEAAGSMIEELTCGHVVCEDCMTKLQDSGSPVSCPTCGTGAVSSSSKRGEAEIPKAQTSLIFASSPRYPRSAKLETLLRRVSERQAQSQHRTSLNKDVIFSQWTKMLDLIGAALKEDGLRYVRIDGRSSLSQRKLALERFVKDPECNIILASIGAAGEGIDLTAANSVHIVEPHWNPMAEAQAIDRVHRIGQDKDVQVIRYIVDDSIEKYIQWIQRYKLRLIKDSLSESSEMNDKDADVRWKVSELQGYLE